MSVSILLVPAAIAAATAIHRRATASTDPGVVYQVDTRMKNVALVRQALSDAGATVEPTEGGLVAEWPDAQAYFQRGDDEIWSAHFGGNIDEAGAIDLIRAVDEAYGLRVQESVLALISERAAGAGMSLTSQTVNADASVTMVLAVDRVRA